MAGCSDPCDPITMTDESPDARPDPFPGMAHLLLARALRSGLAASGVTIGDLPRSTRLGRGLDEAGDLPRARGHTIRLADDVQPGVWRRMWRRPLP